MKESGTLQLVEPGTLAVPGPVGRTVRLLTGLACLYWLYQLVIDHDSLIEMPVSHADQTWPMLIVMLLIINTVVNIGYGVDWGRWPGYASAIALVVIAVSTRLLTGSFDNAILGFTLWLWLVYFYAHVGVSFMLAGVAAIPGCEMRALPDLIGRLTGRAAKEHHCPAFIGKLDQWELQRRDR